MKVMNCPLNGPRNISEFIHGGDVRQMPHVKNCTDRDWAEYVFYSDNSAGVVAEWWLHAPSSYWFIAERHRASDEIMRTYDPCELFNRRIDFNDQDKPATEGEGRG